MRSPEWVPVGSGEYFEVLRARFVGEGQERAWHSEIKPEKPSNASGDTWALREGFKSRTLMVKVCVTSTDGLEG